MNQPPLPLDEAIQALKREPTHAVRVKVDEELTVEVRAVSEEPAPQKTMGDLLREIGRWEGETGAELDALFASIWPKQTVTGLSSHRLSKRRCRRIGP